MSAMLDAMVPYEEKNGIVCVQLEPEDWELYRDMTLAGMEEEKSAELEFCKQLTPQDWEAHLADQGVMFVLLNRANPIGSLSVVEPGDDEKYPELTNLYMLKDYRNPDLEDLLVKSSLTYLAKETPHHVCFGKAKPGDEAPFRTFMRNQFRDAGAYRPPGNIMYKRAEKDLDALRAELG
jgi:hypothetical protein